MYRMRPRKPGPVQIVVFILFSPILIPLVGLYYLWDALKRGWWADE